MMLEPAALRKRPQQLRGEIDALDLELETIPFIRPGPALHYDLRAECLGDELLVRGRLTLDLECLCARCGAWFHRRQAAPDFTRVFQLTADDTAIDLTPDIREDMMLSFPSNWLCRNDCRGLCPGCGADLNHAPCRCTRPRRADTGGVWAALERISPGALKPGGGARTDRKQDSMEDTSNGNAKTQEVEKQGKNVQTGA